MSESTKDRTSEDRLQELIAERDRYQQWLDSLESERPKVPEHIYERISADYSKRLDEAIAALREHLDTLESRLEERKASLEETLETLQARQDELLEREIRYRVGEFSEEEWKKLEGSLKSDIRKSESRRDDLVAEVEHLEATIAQVREPAAAAEASDDDSESLFLEVLAEATATAEAAGGRANGIGAADVGGAVGPEFVEPERMDTDLTPRRPRRPTGLRTLRCETCGTFNLPEAMFCEACGADLPAS